MSANKGKGRDNRGLGADLGTNLIKRGTPVRAHDCDGRASEFVRGKRAGAGNEQKEEGKL